MNESYPAIYRDKLGEEITIINNDGQLLSITIRGVTFTGQEFDSLEAATPLQETLLDSFTLRNTDLCDCEIECDMPLIILSKEEPLSANLHIHLILGAPLPNGGLENEKLQLRLDINEKSYLSCGKHGWFEDELLELQAALPNGSYMKCCFNCAFSDYHPVGSGCFGTLACFRDNKREYLKVKNKTALFQIWNTMTEWVQETYLCPEFEKRVPGTGYRG